VDSTDVLTCGTRCTPCPSEPGATTDCTAGTCTYACEIGFVDCDGDLGMGGNGCEADLTSDANCGGCGVTCGDGHTCNDSGQCCCGTNCGAVGTGDKGCGGVTICCPGDVCMPGCP
jgi:hypothetical protein